MITPNCNTWTLGRFTVRQGIRPDNPGWPQYLVYLGDQLVGKSFSRPDLSCCEWLAGQQSEDIVYAERSAPMSVFAISRRGRPTNAERARRAAMTVEVELA